MSKDIIGISLIIGTGIFHAGAYKRGIWFDNNEKMKLHRKERTGLGFKIDLCFGRTIRPIGRLWERGYWNNEETAIQDIPEGQWDLRLPAWIPTMFVSFGFGKTWSFYLGNKAYGIDPFTRDVTWTNTADRKRAMKENLIGSYFALCPSATSRRTRMT